MPSSSGSPGPTTSINSNGHHLDARGRRRGGSDRQCSHDAGGSDGETAGGAHHRGPSRCVLQVGNTNQPGPALPACAAIAQGLR